MSDPFAILGPAPIVLRCARLLHGRWTLAAGKPKGLKEQWLHECEGNFSFNVILTNDYLDCC